jgi:hypothetical protein
MNNAPEPASSLNNVVHEIASALHTTIRETDESYLKKEPEDAYIDLANRLVLELAKSGLMISTPDHRIRNLQDAAATKIFDILTVWMRAHPEGNYVTRFDFDTGKFEIIVRDQRETRAYFQGTSIQDAYAQAAQTIALEGTL